MKSLFALFALLLLPTGSGRAAVTETLPPVSNEVEIIRAQFGLFNPPDSGKSPFVPSRTIPLVENQMYGWIIVLKTTKTRIKWREEFTLPSPPATWDDTESHTRQSISEDGRVSVTELDVEPEDGFISHIWTVAPGDPSGRYVIRVIIENALERVFEFDMLSDR